MSIRLVNIDRNTPYVRNASFRVEALSIRFPSDCSMLI